LWFPLVILILLDFVAREREKVLSQLGALKWDYVIEKFDFDEKLLNDS
jgi:hypothetical protein